MALVGCRVSGSPVGFVWAVWGRGQAVVQVPTVMMQDPLDTGPVRGSRPQHWVPSQCWDRSPALQSPAVIRVVASLSYEPQEGHEPRLNHPVPQHSPHPTCVGRGHHAGLPWHWVGYPDVRPVASPCSGCPAAAHAWDSCSVPAQHGMAQHSSLSPLPHVPTAPGIAWTWARCAGL